MENCVLSDIFLHSCGPNRIARRHRVARLRKCYRTEQEHRETLFVGPTTVHSLG
jgi:hypothetical protein